jgi:hypothetical protein
LRSGLGGGNISLGFWYLSPYLLYYTSLLFKAEHFSKIQSGTFQNESIEFVGKTGTGSSLTLSWGQRHPASCKDKTALL